MQNPFDGKEIWFLTGSQNLYGEACFVAVELGAVHQQTERIFAQAQAIAGAQAFADIDGRPLQQEHGLLPGRFHREVFEFR